MKEDNDFKTRNERSYSNGEITVYWKPVACIHASSCYRELIEVFDPASRPWVNMKGAPTDRIIETVNLCPTEALSWKWNDESRNTDIPIEGHSNHIKYRRPELYRVAAAMHEGKPLSVKIMPDGPIIVEGTFIIKTEKGDKVVSGINSFCRCGHSKSKPLCDGEHRIKGFTG